MKRFILIIISVVIGCPSIKAVTIYFETPSDRIIKTCYDTGNGLTSVVYIQNGDTLGLDYITKSEIDSLESILK